MVDDEKLVSRLRELLAESDMETTTEKMLRKKLEEEFDTELSDKKALIRDEVDKYINEVQEAQGGGEADDAEEEDEAGESDEASAEEQSTKRRKAASAKASKKQKTEGSGGKARGGFAKLVPVSDELAEVIGKEEASRSELTKFFWDYFKKNELLDPNDKRYVKCDETLKKLFGVNRFLAFGIQKQLSAHIRK